MHPPGAAVTSPWHLPFSIRSHVGSSLSAVSHGNCGVLLHRMHHHHHHPPSFHLHMFLIHLSVFWAHFLSSIVHLPQVREGISLSLSNEAKAVLNTFLSAPSVWYPHPHCPPHFTSYDPKPIWRTPWEMPPSAKVCSPAWKSVQAFRLFSMLQ